MSKVAEILAQMAQNAGQAALRRGAIIGGTIAQAADVPAQIYTDRQYQQQLDLHKAQVQQQMGLEAARGAREQATAARQVGLDKRAQTAQDAADLKEQALKGIIGAGFTADPSKFDLPTAVSKAKELGAEDLIPTVMAVHDKMQPKLAATKPEDNITNMATGAIVTPGAAAPPKPPTAEEDKAKYIGLQARGAQNLPVLPAEKAWMDAYEKEKLLATDKSASAAADRLASTQAQQNKLEKDKFDFGKMQTARSDIQKNVDTPYQTAHSSAETLRDMVQAAQGGNKIAGSLQSLETAAATLRSQGINRLNMAEIGMPATAGSVVDRFLNKVGKWTEGQPVDASLQKDMLDVANILDAAARKKYEAAHEGVNKLYGTTIPQTFPAPPAPMGPQTPSTLTPGLAGLAGRP